MFDPDAGSPAFTQRRDMARGRWYPTGTILPDGTVLSISGWKKGFVPGEGPDPPVLADTSEVYSIYSGTWTSLSSAPKTDISIYPFIQVDPSPNGTRVLYLGPGANAHDEAPWTGPLQPAQRLKNLDAGTPTWETNVGTYTVRGAAFARYNKDKVIKSGGIPSGGGSVTNQADTLTIDMSTGNITAALTDGMCTARSEHQLVVLADGTVLALGGTSVEQGGQDQCSNGVYVTELWDPSTGCWRQLAEMRPRNPKVPRMYHSTAVLLPDASVLSAGGECKLQCPGNPAGDISCRSGDFFKPPYLFKSDNTPASDAERPAITGTVPQSVAYGEGLSFTRTVGSEAGSSAIKKVALVKPGSTTHEVNMSQQYLPLTFTDGATLTVNASDMPNVRLAPPGYYMLFLVNNLNRPSKAPFVVLWGIIESSVSYTVTQQCNGGGGPPNLTFNVSWNTTIKPTGVNKLHLYGPGATCLGEGILTTASSTNSFSHQISKTVACQNGTWKFVVKSTEGNSVSASQCVSVQVTCLSCCGCELE